VLEVAEGEQNSDTLCSTLLQPMGKRMERNPQNVDAPPRLYIQSTPLEKFHIMCRICACQKVESICQ